MSILGTPAGIFADLTLILQIVAFIMLIIGVLYVKKKKFSNHYKMADIAVFFAMLTFLWMSFSFINNFKSLIYNIKALTSLVVTIHVFAGLLALITGIFFVFNRFIKKVRNSMRITFLSWTAALLLGILLYALFYII